jgi:hypothetical protein
MLPVSTDESLFQHCLDKNVEFYYFIPRATGLGLERKLQLTQSLLSKFVIRTRIDIRNVSLLFAYLRAMYSNL